MKNLLNKLSSVSFVDQGYSHQIPTKIIIVTFFFFPESELFWQTILPNIIFLPKYSHSIANLKV